MSLVCICNPFALDGAHFTQARCLIITENVSFKIASEASSVYIFNGQNLIKNAKNGSLNSTKYGGKCQNLNATF